ncbi:MAG TPA: hypothetical protein VF483_10610 [Gemmatimonadaceae bacterium]
MLSVLGLTAQLLIAVPSDTPPPVPHRPRVKAVEISDWYNRRLTLHRTLAYATLPVFAFQWAAGEQIWQKGTAAPTWARTGHRVGATTLAGIFTVNTVTGLWNLWDSRQAPQGRAMRTMHAITMLVADAGFTWAGAKLSNQAETDFNARALHKKVALTCMALTVGSGVIMKFFNK